LAETAEGLESVRIAVLASFTAEPILAFLQCELARRGLWPETYFGPFNSVGRELLDSGSGCLAFAPDVVFVMQLLEDVSPAISRDFLTLDDAGVDDEILEVVSGLEAQLDGFAGRSSASVILHNFPAWGHPARGIYETNGSPSQTLVLARLNRCVADVARARAHVHCLDFDRVCADVGYRRARNLKGWHMGRIALSPEAMKELATVQAADDAHVESVGSQGFRLLDGPAVENAGGVHQDCDAAIR